MKLTNTKIRLLTVLLALVVFESCKESPNYKEARKKVIDLHDKVMADGEKAINNSLLLDSISKTKMPEMLAENPNLDTLAEKIKIGALIKKLTDADNVMMDWMNKFEPDVQNKNNEQAIDYFEKELIKIKKLDGQYKVVLAESDNYIRTSGVHIIKKEDHAAHQH